jgi:hypothetical protein
MTHCLVKHHITGHLLFVLVSYWVIYDLSFDWQSSQLWNSRCYPLSSREKPSAAEIHLRAIQNKRCGMLCSSMTMHIPIQQLALEHCWSISTGSCLTTLLTAVISLQVTTACFPTWRTGWDYRSSTKMRRWLCQNVAELNCGRLLWYTHTKT